MKKKLTAFLAVLLIACAVFPVDAAAAGSKPTTKINATCSIPNITIEVTVPTSTNAYINPKKVTVSLGSKIECGQIFTDQAYIENKSVVPISVSASVTGTLNKRSTMTLRDTTTVGKKLTGKEAFIYLEMHTVEDVNDVPWDSSYDATRHIRVTTGTETKEDVITIGAASEDDHFCAFRLTGDCVESPTGDAWNSKDTFTAKIVFTFRPLPLSS